MDIDTARKIDYWMGVPICFFLTVISRLLRTFSFKNKKENSPKKFLFIELSEMGSAILAYPTMRRIKDEYPQSELFFLIFKKNRISVDILKIIPEENVVTISDSSLSVFIRDSINAILHLRKEKIDVTFDLELFSRASAILTYLCGTKKQIGLYKYNMEGLYRGKLHTHKVQYNFQYHISKTFLSFLQVIKKHYKDFPTMDEDIIDDEDLKLPQIEPSEEERRNIWDKLKSVDAGISKGNKLIIINPNAGELPIRAWPLENYTILTKKLLQDENNYVIITGTEEACADASIICKSVGRNDRCIDLTTKTSFSELLHLYDICDILVTNDCGPAHFASLTSIKEFVFFGPESPVLYSPLGPNVTSLFSNFPCSPCLSAFNHRKTSCCDNKCLQAIKVENVYNLIKKELE